MDLPYGVFTSASVKNGVPSLSRPVAVGTFIGSDVHSRRSSAILRFLYCSDMLGFVIYYAWTSTRLSGAQWQLVLCDVCWRTRAPACAGQRANWSQARATKMRPKTRLNYYCDIIMHDLRGFGNPVFWIGPCVTFNIKRRPPRTLRLF